MTGPRPIARRIAVRLVIVQGRLAERARFGQLRDPGDPVGCAVALAAAGADEVSVHEAGGRCVSPKIAARLAAELAVPFTVSGGIRRVEEVEELVGVGASRVALNSAALIDPSLVGFCVTRFGLARIVVAMDVRPRLDGSPEVFAHGGTLPTGRDVTAWCRQAQERGAGEVAIHSLDRQGSGAGFDVELCRAAAAVPVPVVASGGAGSVEHFVELFAAGAAGAAASSAFLSGRLSIAAVRQACAEAGIAVSGARA